MKIGIDAREIETQPTGVGRVLFSLLGEWAKFDLPAGGFDLPPDLKFILYFKNRIPDLELPERFEKKLLGLPALPRQALRAGHKSNAWFTHWRLPRAAEIDLVVILFCPGYVAPAFYRGDIALELHDIIYQARPDLYNWPSVWDRILLKTVSRMAAKKAKIILTCSKFSRQEILKYYQVQPEKVFDIPLAADKSFYPIQDADKIREIKEKYQIRDKFVFYLGSIFKRRHLPETLLAFEKAAAEIGDAQFLVVGADYSGDNINRLAEQINQRLGRLAVVRKDYLGGGDLAAVYSAAELMVYLSDYEGFGLPVLESMACGTPVVTSCAASIPEVAGEAALYIKDNSNIDAIAMAMTKGLSDGDLRRELTEKGLAQAKKFSWEKTARETLDALLSVR